ncbi:hypothetical protein TSAR_007515 [Trichomalopsis sarcophagae]|uniref:Uncharacterized protein n=1 Tax=Trichomalopsis sarcophagae TaxID=543379 RepID=A0A232EIX6_9HYME|nr:hypothetical protein TSAR_007515 [Trichomalopsis sarcophagae]
MLQKSCGLKSIIKLASDTDADCIWIIPQSVRFTRPLQMCFEKENNATTRKKYDRLQNEIKNLKRHRFKWSNGKTIHNFDFRKKKYKEIFLIIVE